MKATGSKLELSLKTWPNATLKHKIIHEKYPECPWNEVKQAFFYFSTKFLLPFAKIDSKLESLESHFFKS